MLKDTQGKWLVLHMLITASWFPYTVWYCIINSGYGSCHVNCTGWGRVEKYICPVSSGNWKRYSERSPHFSCSVSAILCAQSTIVPLNSSAAVLELGCIQFESFRKLYNPSHDGFLLGFCTVIRNCCENMRTYNLWLLFEGPMAVFIILLPYITITIVGSKHWW